MFLRKRETPVKFNPGLSANRPSNNWALDNNYVQLQLSLWLASTQHPSNVLEQQLKYHQNFLGVLKLLVPNKSCKQLQTILTRFVKFLRSVTNEGWINILQLKFQRRHNVVV